MSLGMGAVIGACAAIGAVTVVATLAVGHGTLQTRATEEYGKRLIVRTAEYLGPDVADPAMRFIPNRLACASCHPGAGAEPGELSLVTAVTEGTEALEDRINECIARNMNGRPLPKRGAEMSAMIGWLGFLADQEAAMGASQRKTHDPPRFKTPARAADPQAGERLFEKRCADCHGKDGAGLLASRDMRQGYLFPPLWGAESFSDGSEMHNLLAAARFIKAKMPLGRPDLDDEQALDVAAFIHSRPRPRLATFGPSAR